MSFYVPNAGLRRKEAQTIEVRRDEAAARTSGNPCAEPMRRAEWVETMRRAYALTI